MLPLLLFIFFEPYTLAISLFERGLAFHNFLAFLSFYTQWRGLIGSRGIAPVKEMMTKLKERGWTAKTRWKTMPTLFWYSDSDRMIRNVQIAGMVASVLAFLGIYPGLMILLAAVCYSSVKVCGSVFTQLQMHAHIMEIDLLYCLIHPFVHICPSSLVVLASLLNWRIMMGGGAGKWFGGDTSWRNGTAMTFHYWTQPLPNPMSPYMHRLPRWIHTVETYASIVFESGAALFVFAPVWLRVIPWFCFSALMLAINLTGNFAQISILTLNESILLLNDNWWNAIFDAIGWIVPGTGAMRQWLLFAHNIPYLNGAPDPYKYAYNAFNLTLSLLAFALIVLPYGLISIIPLVGTFRGHNALELLGPYSTKPLAWYRAALHSKLYQSRIKPVWHWMWKWMERGFVEGSNFDLFSSYVKFGSMTRFRHEIIIEASLDGSTWFEYVFKYKPSSVTRRPPFFPLHYPAMDWRLWFLPLQHSRGGDPPIWFLRILARLLECESDVMDLFAEVPKECDGRDGRPKPQFIRAVLYDYRFALEYQKEDEMKKLVKECKYRGHADIDTESEEEIEVDAVPAQATGEQRKKLSGVHGLAHPDGVARSSLAPISSEQKLSDARDDRKSLLHSGKPGEREALHEEDVKDQVRKEPKDQQEEELVESVKAERQMLRDDDEDEEDDFEEEDEHDSRRDVLVQAYRLYEARVALSRLLGLPPPPPPARRSLPRRRAAPGKVWKKVQKVTAPVPQYDDQGRRIWWVRRHRVGAYGPTLTATPPVRRAVAAGDDDASTADVDAWEQLLDEEDE